MTNAYVSGTISASSGSIGGWTIGANGISRSYGNTIAIGNVVIENSYGINLNVSSSFQNIWMVRSDGSVYFKAGDGNVTSGRNYISLDTNPAYASNNGLQFNNGIFKVDYLGNLTSTSGFIGGWTIGANNLSSNRGSNVVELNSSGGYVLASGGGINPISTNSNNGIVQIGAGYITLQALGFADSNVIISSSVGLTPFYAISMASQRIEFDCNNGSDFSGTGATVSRNGTLFQLTPDFIGSTTEFKIYTPYIMNITSGLSISIGNDILFANKDINIGYGSSLSSRALVKSNAIYQYTSTSGAANVAIASSPTAALYRFTSTFTAKEQITPLSNYSKLDPIVPIEKISSSSINVDPYRVLNITPVWFKSSLPSDEGKSNIGFIAEDVMQKYPELAILDEEGKAQLYNINGIVASILVVLQRQEKIIENLTASVIALQNAIIN
jgi:hypothetical protein